MNSFNFFSFLATFSFIIIYVIILFSNPSALYGRYPLMGGAIICSKERTFFGLW